MATCFWKSLKHFSFFEPKTKTKKDIDFAISVVLFEYRRFLP